MNGTADGTVKPCEMFSRDNTDRVFLGYHHTLNTNELNVF